jgi:hypothetical protein
MDIKTENFWLKQIFFIDYFISKNKLPKNQKRKQTMDWTLEMLPKFRFILNVNEKEH